MLDTKIARVAMPMKKTIRSRGRRELLSKLVFAIASIVLLCLPAAAFAQTGTGQGIISGIITDPAGASIPHAAVAIKNSSTNVVINVTTNGTGYYEIRNLNPGTYEISVAASGFEKTVDSGVILEADGHPSVDLALKVGSSNETVTINGVSPLIDRDTVSIGQVLTSEEMQALPNGQAPIWLAMLAPGVQSNYAQNYQLGGADPSWNGGGPQFGAYGRIGANEFSLDGAPNMSNQRGQAINLSAEELGQTSVNITQFDASVGHTYGISLDQTTKSGTNDLHGGLRYRRYDLRYFAKQHFQRLNYQYAENRDGCSTNAGSAQCQLDQNQFGYPGSHMNYGDAGFGGPVFIPHLFDGRNKLFFFVGTLIESPNNASSNTIAVPSAKNQTGDFSDLANGSTTVPAPANASTQPAAVTTLFTQAGCPSALYYGQYQLFNPYTVSFVNGHPSRLPFCGNVIPSSLISTLPLIKTINSYLPAPNYGTNPTGNNFIYEAAGFNTYREVTNRFDYAVNNADHLFFRWSRGHYTLHNSTFLQNNFMSYHQDKWIDTAAVGWSHILSPTTVADVTVGGTSYSGGGFTYPSEQELPSSLGLPTYVDQYAGKYAQFPILSISGYQQIGGTDFNNPIYRSLAIRGNLTTVRGSSTWRAGAEWRQQHVQIGGPGTSNTALGPSGQYSFDDTYVQQNDGTSPVGSFPTTNSGLPYASFLLGIQSTSTASIVPQTSRANPYFGFYAGDTWRVTRKLTLVPGIRYEFEYGPAEKYNRQIVGWDPNAQLTFAPAVQLAYKAILPTLTAAQQAVMPASLPVQGGPIYAGVNGASNRQWANNWRFLPRIGAAYSINDTTVVRAGAGLYFDTLNVLNESSTIDLDGFAQTTGPVNSSTVFGSDFVQGTSPLSNPFPSSNGTRFVPAVGNSLGADYYAGSNATIGIYPHDRKPARSARVQLSMEHQFGRSLVVQVAYVGSRTTAITLDGNQNNTRTNAAGYETATAVPGSFYTGGNQPNSANNNLLGTNITNPFYMAYLNGGLQTSDPVYYNVLSKSSYVTSAKTTIANLVKSNPQLNTLRFYPSVGTSQFQEFQANVSKRISNGLVANFTYQKNLQYDRDFYQYLYDTHPSRESTLVTPPWRATATWVYTFPFGPSQRFARSGVLATIFGGYKLSGSWETNPGTLLTFTGNGSPSGQPNIFFVGDPNSIRIKNNTSFNTSGTVPTIYGFNAQAATAVATTTNSITTCAYSGTGFVLNSSCQPDTYNLSDFPRHIEGVRSEDLENWNANFGRTLNPNERFKVEARADFYNVFNHQRVAAVGGAQLNPTNAQFGQITSDNGNGREVILQMLLTF